MDPSKRTPLPTLAAVTHREHRDPELRVLHVLGSLRPSGAEVMLAVAAPLFAREGVTGEIVSTGAEPGPYAARLEAAGYRIHHVPFAKSLGFFVALWRLIRRGGYDAVHVHTERAAFWIGLTALGAGVPVALKSIHNAFAFTGNLRVRRKVQRHLMSWMGMSQVAVGPSVRETERRHFGLETVVINNWFDAERFQPPGEEERRLARRSLDVADGEIALVSVANCNAFKNHVELIRAMALVPPGRRPLWLHVGEEEAGHPERELARATGVADRLRFLGSLEDVRVALHAADCFVMPSLREGLPISALEALATGLPAILTDVDGLRDLRPTFPGLRYAEPSASSLAEALLAFAGQEGDALRRMASEHPAIVRREYGALRGVEAYVRIYRGGAVTAAGGKAEVARPEGSPPRVQVLITAHNRRDHTLACLERLEVQGQRDAFEVRVVLVDDASSDGTAAAVRQRFPTVQVVEGSGQLYWNGGIRLAFEVASREDPDYYLLLNDDTYLLAGALGRMVATHRALVEGGERPCIVVGSTLDPQTGEQTYGGWLRGPWFNPGHFRPSQPGVEARRCDTMNGNCVLVPRDVAQRVGNLDPVFTHRMGDLDYGLRASRAGCSLWVAPGYLGECVHNTGQGLWVEASLGVVERWRRLLGPKGLPLREWLAFTSRHFGPFWPLHFAWPYAKNAWKALRGGLGRP